MRKPGVLEVSAFFILLWLAVYGGQIQGCTLPSLTPSKATAATYTYDDKAHVAPAAVRAALNTLNRRGIIATEDEVDTMDSTGAVPEQYRVSRPAAVKAGLPALVVMAGEKVITVLKDPKTEDEVLKAVP